jgi:hypothetical protein
VNRRTTRLTLLLIVILFGWKRSSHAQPADLCTSASTCNLACPRGATQVSEAARVFCKHKNNKKLGPMVLWYDNGKKDLQGAYVNDRPHGVFLEWYANGQLWRRINYRHGRPTGISVTWYNSGEKQSETRRHRGITSIEIWYRNGKPSLKRYTRRGEPYRRWIEWSEDGVVTVDRRYRNGKLLDHITAEDGAPGVLGVLRSISPPESFVPADLDPDMKGALQGLFRRSQGDRRSPARIRLGSRPARKKRIRR